MAEELKKAEVKKISAEEVLAQLRMALEQRKTALSRANDITTNPLDRLSIKDKIEEIDSILTFLASAR